MPAIGNRTGSRAFRADSAPNSRFVAPRWAASALVRNEIDVDRSSSRRRSAKDGGGGGGWCSAPNGPTRSVSLRPAATQMGWRGLGTTEGDDAVTVTPTRWVRIGNGSVTCLERVPHCSMFTKSVSCSRFEYLCINDQFDVTCLEGSRNK